ncbi:MAG: hypothetical protein LBV12_09930 [Puniceicoccales bacterium]|nr:hypothetical protein [Puniceicoccales bacterium]
MTFFEKTFNPVGATYFSHSVAAEKSTDQKGEVEFGRFSLEDHYKIYSDNKTNLRITFDGKSFVAKPDMVQVREGFQRYYQGTGQTPSEDDWLTWVDDPELRQSYTIFYKAASGWEISSPYVLRVKECH